MSETEDMTAPVTRGELRMELTELRAEIREQFATFQENLRREFRALLREEVLPMLRSFEENMRREFRGLDDKYIDLPPRVARIEAAELPLRVEKLEATVFPPPAPAKRTKRRRAG